MACFSDRELFGEYARNHHVDAFLAGESWIDEAICEDSRRWLLLAEDDGESGTICGGTSGIDLYGGRVSVYQLINIMCAILIIMLEFTKVVFEILIDNHL